MSRSLLCETVTGQSMADLRRARDAAVADMVEVRLDGVTDVDVAGALHGRRKPVVVTCRPEWEGGRFAGTEEERHRILVEALTLGAEFVDVEWMSLHGLHRPRFDDIVRTDPARVVVSSHDFEGVPADVEARARDMRGYGAAVIKVAVMPHALRDTLPLREIARDGDAVVVGMGDSGVPTRLLASRYGSRWSYAGNGVAPGQIPAQRMLSQYRFREIGPSTRVFGVVSVSALHSFSPLMHNAAFAADGLDAVYIPLQTAEFADFDEFASALGVEGVSVTIPFKGDALRAASKADALTRQVGAANTLRRVQDAWEATNTDVTGFLAPLDQALGRPLTGVRASVLGGGGSARAVVVALLSRGAQVTVHTRRREQAEEVTEDLGAAIGPWPVTEGWDLLVNCTPLGSPTMRDESPLPGGPFTGELVYDVTYGDGESRLVREAREAGCRTLDGLPMLVAQAERQFEWWIGRPPRRGVMRNAVVKTGDERSVPCT
ncbi:MAG TPA: type I 3-dehydroquinate dehydratase [Vicinamibacterales bacterium]|nr:type I 3-dehydroquinate dehydratase [Vicinamibacterales bacterium]